MSHIATGIVQRRKAGGTSNKAVLMFMAACASDDGTGIWTSKGNMAADLEMSKRTVQRATDALLTAGLISEIGQRKCRNGFTVEYRINLEVIEKLPSTRVTVSPVDTTSRGDTLSPVTPSHPTGDTMTPQEVTQCHPNRTGTIPEPCGAPDAPRTQDQDLGGEGKEGREVPAFDFVSVLDEFERHYPRLGSSSETSAALRAALEAGTPAETILSAAKTYAKEQEGNDRKYIAYSHNWLKSERWKQHEGTAAPQSEDEKAMKVLQGQADAILKKRNWARSTISPSQARHLIHLGLVTKDDCLAAGVDT